MYSSLYYFKASRLVYYIFEGISYYSGYIYLSYFDNSLYINCKTLFCYLYCFIKTRDIKIIYYNL